MRIRRKPWTQKELDTNIKIIHSPENNKGLWHKYFNNDNPIHVEIGCGKGGFIIETSAINPMVNYVAVEKEEHVIVVAARKATAVDANIAFIPGDVKELDNYFDQKEISRIYINFCDPWPNRKKWAKRRLTYHSFLDMYKGLLTDGGEIFFKTDNKELFEFSLNEFSGYGWTLKNITLDLHSSELEGNIMTEYEEKFSSMGMPIYRCEAIFR